MSCAQSRPTGTAVSGLRSCLATAAGASAGLPAQQHHTQETEAELQASQDPGPSLLYPGMPGWQDFQHLSEETVDLYNLAVLQVPPGSVQL